MIYDLKYVVANVLMKGDTLDERKYMVLLKHAINGFRKLNLHNLVTNTVRTERVPLNPRTNTLNLPNDYLDWFKVAAIFRYDCGVDVNGCETYRERIVTLDYNPNILGVGEKIKVCECNDQTMQQAYVNENTGQQTDPAQIGWYGFLYYAPRVNNGQYTAGIYTAGSNVYRGSFIVDEPNRMMRFSSCIGERGRVKEILLEYKATAISADGNAIIPEGALPALIAYVKWMEAEDEKDKYWTDYHMKVFGAEANSLNMRDNAMTDKEWYTIMRESVMQSPKV